MQTTLLGVAIAIILALVAALVAPLVIDWNNYRSVFEEQASALTGLNVHVKGAIDARILPTPHLMLRNVEIGQAGREPQLRVATLELDVGLGPLLRGEVRASRLRLLAPQLEVGLDRAGAIDWPALAPSFSPATFSISQFTVENGRVVLNDAGSGSRVVLQRLWFNGDIRSFVGPFSGEGAFVMGDALYGYRIAGSRPEGNQGLKLRLGVDPSDYPLTTDIDGLLLLDHGVPRFEGTFALLRPVGATLASGQRVVSDPWHVHGNIRATAAAAALRDIVFQYGPDDRALVFSGKADLSFGPHPRVDGDISAPQVDLDHALAAPDMTHRPPLLLARNFAESFVATVKLPMPAKIAINIEAVTVGGTTLQALRGDLRSDESGWSFNRLEFRAPGLTQVNLTGRLKNTPQGLALSGPATLDSADADMLLAWLEGRHGAAPSGAKPLHVRGDVTVANDQVAVDRLTAALDRQTVEGRLSYAWASAKRPAMLDADLRAAELDVDALAAFGRASGADQDFDLPQQVALALDIGKATYAGVDAQGVKAQVKLNAGILQIDRLSIAALGGAAFDISGRIEQLSSQPRGRLALTLDAPVPSSLADVVGKFAPDAAAALRRFADRLAPAKLHGTLSVEQLARSGSAAKFDLSGQLGVMRIALNGDAKGDPSRFGEAAVRIESRLDADDGGALAKLLGLDPILSVDQLPGRLTLSAAGPLNGDLHLDGLVTAGGFAGTASGALRLNGEQAPAGQLQIKASAADLRPLHQILTGQPGAAVPVVASAALAVAGNDLSLTNLAVSIGKTKLQGRLALNLAKPIGIDGAFESDDVDAAGALALLLGMPSKPAGESGPWSARQLGAGVFGAMSGAASFKLKRAAFGDTQIGRDLKGIVRFGKSEIALEDLDGSFAAGRLGGKLTFRRAVDGLAAHFLVELAGADAATILAPGKTGLDGTLTVKLQGDSLGASPAGFIGSLHGSGTVALADAHFAGLDPAAFDVAIRAADQSGTIEEAKIRAALTAALANSRLAVPHGVAAVTITGGEFNLASVALPAQDGAILTLSGALDLGKAAVDARMTLSGRPAANALIATRPEFSVAVKGPLGSPQRTLDVSALTGWLTLRAAELQTRRLQSMEANRRPETLGPVVRPDSPLIRSVPRGAVVESATPANMSAALPNGPRALDRLQAEQPSPAPDETHSNGSPDRGAAPAVTLPGPSGLKPVMPSARPDPNDATAASGPSDQSKQRPPSQPAASEPAAPQTAGPVKRSLFDFLFRPQD